MIEIPEYITEVLTQVERKPGVLDLRAVGRAMDKAIGQVEGAQDERSSWWPEWAACGFNTRNVDKNGPWGTFFRPAISLEADDGSMRHGPDIAEATPEVVEYWSQRAKEATHPSLVARYADLVWDFGHLVTDAKPDIGFAHQAIDAYIAMSKLDGDVEHFAVIDGLERALVLSLSIGDQGRTSECVEAMLDYANRTAQDDLPGTYSYLIEELLLAKGRPKLTADQEQRVLYRFERVFAMMSDAEGEWKVDPSYAAQIGGLLATYYERAGLKEDRVRILAAIARTYELRADMGDALSAVMFLNDARKYFALAGCRDEADRIRRKSQDTVPEAQKELAPQTFEFKISNEHRDEFFRLLLEDGLLPGLDRLATEFVVRQADVNEQIEQNRQDFPMLELFPAALLGEGGITADVGDSRGDESGLLVHQTTQRVRLSAHWISWGIDRLIQEGLTVDQVVGYVMQSPAFEQERRSLVKDGVQAHFDGDYVKSIHVLLPQIERAIVRLPYLVGGTSMKSHRSGRGNTQSKSLEDALKDEAVREAIGEDLAVYMTAVLAHPKGMNIRNLVCHGLCPSEFFCKNVSDRVVHVLLALGALRSTPDSESTVPAGEESIEPDS